jgi:hypothetical protein
MSNSLRVNSRVGASGFYSLYCARQRGAVELRSIMPIDDPYRLLHENGSNQRITFSVERGSVFLDLLDTGWGFLFLISDRLVRVLTDEKVTGWSPWEAIVRMPDGGGRSDYKGLSVQGSAGPIDVGAGQATLKPRRYGSGGAISTRLGLPFEQSSWDGTDIFVPSGTGYILCVERVRELFRKHGVTNARLTPIEEIEQLE